MKMFAAPPRIYLHRQLVDFRKSINGLSVIVESELELPVMSGALFIFCNRAKDTLKILYWDKTGFALWYKRLKKDKFKWPNRAYEECMTLTVTPELEQTDAEKESITYERKKPVRKPLPKGLPREVVIYDIAEEDKSCDDCGHELHQLGEDKSEKLQFIPAQVKVIEHVRPSTVVAIANNMPPKLTSNERLYPHPSHQRALQQLDQ
jgi:transposase